MKVTAKIHVTANEIRGVKRAVEIYIKQGAEGIKIGRTKYYTRKDDGFFLVTIVKNTRGIGFIGAPLRETRQSVEVRL